MREPFSAFIEAISEEFASLRMLVERAAAQVSDEQFFANLDNEANSVGTLMQHIGGNLRSRWQDFRTTDGEKPDRFRDREFEAGLSRADVEAKWRQGDYDVMTSAEFQQALKDNHVVLVTWRDIQKAMYPTP